MPIPDIDLDRQSVKSLLLARGLTYEIQDGPKGRLGITFPSGYAYNQRNEVGAILPTGVGVKADNIRSKGDLVFTNINTVTPPPVEVSGHVVIQIGRSFFGRRQTIPVELMSVDDIRSRLWG